MTTAARPRRIRATVLLLIVLLSNLGFLALCALAPHFVARPVFGAVPVSVVGGMALISIFILVTIAATSGDDDSGESV